MKISSLRTRFALWTALLILLVLAAFGAYVYYSMANGLHNALDDTLKISSSQITGSFNVDNGTLILPDALNEPPEADAAQAGFSVRILTPDGLVLHQSGFYATQFPTVSPPLPNAIFSSLPDADLRLYTVPITDNNQLVAIVQVAQSTNSIEDTLGRLLATLLIAAPLLLLATAASAYFLAARALHPVDEMTQIARRISAEDLSARLNMQSDDELGRLASTFDEMLARLDDSFQRERQFTADASHELRTPLTAMQAILSVTRQRRRKPAEYEQALDDLSEETVRLRSLVESLLTLARGDLHPIELNETVDLSTLLDDVTESLRSLAEAKDLALRYETEPNLRVRGEANSLIRLFINLVDNAIKYTEQGSVYIHAKRRDGLVQVKISDTGIGIPSNHLSHIFERFYRVQESRSQKGTGLGLALAQQIVAVHGGSITVMSQPEKGSTFVVRLPIEGN